jgi:hypothetical protein
MFVFGSKHTGENCAGSTQAEDEEATMTYTEPHEEELECENPLASELEVMNSTLLSDGDIDESFDGFV